MYASSRPTLAEIMYKISNLVWFPTDLFDLYHLEITEINQLHEKCTFMYRITQI